MIVIAIGDKRVKYELLLRRTAKEQEIKTNRHKSESDCMPTHLTDCSRIRIVHLITFFHAADGVKSASFRFLLCLGQLPLIVYFIEIERFCKGSINLKHFFSFLQFRLHPQGHKSNTSHYYKSLQVKSKNLMQVYVHFSNDFSVGLRDHIT